MTATGLLLIPLGILLLFGSWRLILIALPSFALLHGAAVLNLGTVGLQPGYFFALLIIGRTFLEISLLRQPLNRAVLLQMLPLGLLVVISVLTLWGAVTFFHGDIPVIGGTDSLQLERARPYQFRRENITQLTYIAINTALVYAVAHQAARMGSYDILATADKGLLLALGLATFASAWQLAAYSFDIYFPNDFFLSNVGYAQTRGEVSRQLFFGYLRLNGPFTEPSALAYFFSGFLFYTWKRCRRQPTFLLNGLVISTVVLIFLAYSTTGYVVLSVFTAIAAIDLLADFARKRTGPFGSGYQTIAIAILVVVAIVAAVVLVHQHWSGLDRIFQTAITDKPESESFQSRMGADLMGMNVVTETWGLGLGLGSHRPNSLVLTLLSNVGIIGTLVFAAFVFQILRRPPFESSVTIGGRALTSVPLRFFIVGFLTVHVFSNPNLNEAILWVGFGLMVGYLASRESETATSSALVSGFFEPPAAPQYREMEGSARGRR